MITHARIGGFRCRAGTGANSNHNQQDRRYQVRLAAQQKQIISLETSGHKNGQGLIIRKALKEVVGRDGFEPSTNWLKANCSTTELTTPRKESAHHTTRQKKLKYFFKKFFIKTLINDTRLGLQHPHPQNLFCADGSCHTDHKPCPLHPPDNRKRFANSLRPAQCQCE